MYVTPRETRRPGLHATLDALRGPLLPALIIAALVPGVSTVLRLALLARPETAVSPGEGLAAVAMGWYYDLAMAAWLAAPAALALALVPARAAATRMFRGAWIAIVGLAAHALLVEAVAEWVFWDEFAARFNFIAVDYLIFTREVLGNIRESYTVGLWLALIALPAVVIAGLAAPSIWRRTRREVAFGARLRAAAIFAAAAAVSAVLVASEHRSILGSDTAREIAGNGAWEFLAALRANELSYERYYATLPAERLRELVPGLLTASGERWSAARRSAPERVVLDSLPERRLSVVMISVESFGAEFMGAFGNPGGLTPRMDALARESLFFTNVYATGNRTVRGLEALSLAIPPTPGQSILKRPYSERLFTLGSVFEERGYATRFLYGGYGYFDGMNSFFAANKYGVLDRMAIPSERIEHESIWGVADEHLFDFALEQIERARGGDAARPFFFHIMTTSNHRPYTYPAGRIDIASGTGRDGAVKYSDYAIGRFIDMARTRPWFDDTVFVIVADHGANARGTSRIPVEQYRIPLLVHSPKHISPVTVDRLMSQIDVAPTLLGLLRFSYHTKFMGRDIFRSPPAEDRAFVANYQTLGYLRDGRLISLEPGRKISLRPYPTGSRSGSVRDTQVRDEAIAWYQTAAAYYIARQFNDDNSNESRPVPADVRVETSGAPRFRTGP